MMVGNLSFGELLKRYEKEMEEADLRGCIFGHALENHLHVNILPEDYEAYKKGIVLIRKWAEETVNYHGKISGEHGIGKLRRQILGDYISEDYLIFCRKLKVHLDVEDRLNHGNILE